MSQYIPKISTLSATVNGFLAVSIGYIMASTTLSTMAPAVRASFVDTQALPKAPTQASTQQAVREIVDTHLFGQATAKPKAQSAANKVQKEAPATRLNLTLRGVLAYEPNESAMAIIVNNGKEQVYTVGEQIVGNAILQAVLEDRVIIRRNGRDETLRLPKERNISGIQSAQAKQLPSSTQLKKAEKVTTSAGNNSAANISVASASELRQKILQRPELMGDLIAVRPYKKDGKQAGYRVYPKSNQQLFQQFGLKAGDVITSINGTALDSNKNSLRALSQLSTASSVNITVLRNGTTLPLSASF